MEEKYIIDKCYRCTGNYKQDKDDQWLAWINREGKGLRLEQGIQRLHYFPEDKNRIPAFVVLQTKPQKKATIRNPWDDIIDTDEGQITYWGDAKKIIEGTTKHYTEWEGNKVLAQLHDLVLENALSKIPPILHVSIVRKGGKMFRKFNGLCVLKGLEPSWMEDKGHRIPNYKATLDILDVEEVHLNWIHSRREKGLENAREASNIPKAWKSYVRSGDCKKLKIHKKQIRSNDNQLPNKKSEDGKMRDLLLKLHPTKEFEPLVVKIMEGQEITQSIEGTSPTKDGGFDFFGYFKLPSPLEYKIKIKGEVKRKTSGVGPVEVSRLVARLRRDEYGIFVTTSYFTSDAQEEVLKDEYPVHLISCVDLIKIIKGMGIRNTSSLEEWIESIREEVNSKSK